MIFSVKRSSLLTLCAIYKRKRLIKLVHHLNNSAREKNKKYILVVVTKTLLETKTWRKTFSPSSFSVFLSLSLYSLSFLSLSLLSLPLLSLPLLSLSLFSLSHSFIYLHSLIIFFFLSFLLVFFLSLPSLSLFYFCHSFI